jgi:hypothetical protein
VSARTAGEFVDVWGGLGLKAWPPRPDPIEVPPVYSPRRFSRALALVPLLTLALGSFATAHAGKVCEVPSSSGPVSLIILASGSKVHAYARTLKGTVARRDAETVIFHDGRVITADIEAANRHLNDLGWASRSIKVVASFPAPRARPSGGWG